MPQKSSFTRWYFQIGFLFPPRNLGKLDKFDEDIFQIGWFNHQQTCQSFLQIFPICTDSGTFSPLKIFQNCRNLCRSLSFLLINFSPPTSKPQTPCLGKKNPALRFGTTDRFLIPEASRGAFQQVGVGGNRGEADIRPLVGFSSR